eukprot:49786-Prymnesium_polylepis.4
MMWAQSVPWRGARGHYLHLPAHVAEVVVTRRHGWLAACVVAVADWAASGPKGREGAACKRPRGAPARFCDHS